MRKRIFKLVAILLVTILIQTVPNTQVAASEAANTLISVEEFSQYVAKEVTLAAANGSYAEGLKAVGIIKEGEFSSYSKNITRGDALVILNRADEFLNGTKVEEALVQLIIEKRISDIGKVAEGKRADVAKAYLKGFMKGYYNGAYSADRELRVTKKITKAGALSCIKMLKNRDLRAKMSPDAQLIRTTKLPKNAKTYPYILASFPNAYYEKNKKFEGRTIYDMNGNLVVFKSGVDYINPVEVNKFSASWYESDFKNDYTKYRNSWADKAAAHVKNVFNVDYRTIDYNWVQDMVKLSTYYGSVHSEWYQERLESYERFMKEAKTVVKTNKIATDCSSIYYFDNKFFIRVYVRYMIVTTDISPKIDLDTLIMNDSYKGLLFSTGIVDMRGYKPAKWVEECFDIGFIYNPEVSDLMGVATMDIDINN
jgi:hypothetical protein